MIEWLSDVSDWSGALPAALVLRGASPERRRTLLKALVARALAVEPTAVAIEHRAQAAPALIQPADAGLFLSSASRGEWAVVAAARAPLGVDVEAVDREGEVPWNVLHPIEAAALKPLQGETRARAFAWLWSVKEAYVKALRVGLREAESFSVLLKDGASARIDDPLLSVRVAQAQTAWRSAEGRSAAISIVLLDPPHERDQVPWSGAPL